MSETNSKTEELMDFSGFGFSDEVLEAIFYMGYKNPTPVQTQAIPMIMEGRDVLGCAQTGTGKTAAFILPVLNRMMQEKGQYTKTLILVPTRELAVQIDQQIQGFAYFTSVSSIAIYGGGKGDNWGQQKTALSKGADIIVATPGKLISHLNMGYVKFDKIDHLILDEADRMLDIGFFDDIMKIIGHLPKKRQTLMFSATMAPKIKQLANKILTQPEMISLSIAKPAEGVLQAAYLVHDHQKVRLLDSLIRDKDNYKSILIFASTKRKVSEIVRTLKQKGYEVEGISSDFDQKAREEVLRKFRAKRVRIIVATDVLSRGIDIKDINLVVNYDVPGDAADYVHRIGRTARASTTGVALTFINEEDGYKFQKIETLIEREVPKSPLPPELGEGPSPDILKKGYRPPGKSYNRNSRHSGRSKGNNHRNKHRNQRNHKKKRRD